MKLFIILILIVVVVLALVGLLRRRGPRSFGHVGAFSFGDGLGRDEDRDLTGAAIAEMGSDDARRYFSRGIELLSSGDPESSSSRAEQAL
jgi:hypothetical protein